ncbi:MAG: RdgB/HAM1 family non-canonical purine NTP pyrophosphatase [Alphaproteobacteria bacterium]|nr:RdgB/HAM1 family non-canonical purine NTP pyrophosphatase [Alphaproteobacteria bacterium]
MTELLFATNNLHKLREIRDILGTVCSIKCLKEVGLDIEIPETCDTLEGNASQKAWFIHEKTGMNCFADDTGLEIDALAGRPGVFSARYAGPGCSFDDNIEKVLLEMKDVTDRTARFRCVFSLILEGVEHTFEGVVNGKILTARSGTEGFGYDPVFLPDGYRQSFAEMPPYLKNGISHRGRAATAMEHFLKNRNR